MLLRGDDKSLRSVWQVVARSARTYVLVKWQLTLIDDMFFQVTLGRPTERRVCDREEVHQQIGHGSSAALSYSVAQP
jgi:hypothetical protein